MARKGGMATGVEVARISVKVSPDTRKFRGELQKDLEEIERTMKGEIEVKANLDAAKAMSDFKSLMAQLKAQGAKGVKINTSVSESVTGGGSGGKGGRSPKTGGVDEDANFLQRMFDNLRNKLMSAPNFGSGINLTGYLVILTAIAAVAAPLAGLITALMLSLPGLMSLVLTPIAAITLGLDGLKKAAEVLKQPFQELKDIMSGAVQDQFTPVFQKLTAIFPVLKDALPEVSQGLADMLESVVGVATSPKSLEMIRGTILNIGSALSAASPGIGNLTEALIGLANTFTGGPLQGLVGWFNDAMASFNQWVMKAQASGELETIFDGLGSALKIVADVLVMIAKYGIDTILNPEAWNTFLFILKAVGLSLVYTFAASKAFLSAIGAAASWLSSAWGAVKSALVGIIELVVRVASQISTAFSSAVATVAGVWDGIKSAAAAAFNAIPGIVSAAWETVSSAVQTGIATVVSFVAGLPGQIVAALGNLGGLLLGAGKAIMDGLLSGLKAAWEGVKNFVSGIAGWIKANKGPISYDKTVLEPNGQALMQGLGKGLENGFAPVLDQAKSMAGKIADAFASGGDPTQLISGFSGKEVSNMEKTLALESKRLSVQARALDYQSKTTGNAALKARADEIRLQKDQIDLQKDMLSLTQEYSGAAGGGSGKSSGNVFLDAINELMKLPSGFASATAGQAMQDLNISGDGALQAVAGWGMDFAKKGVTNIFNTSNVDDTLALHNNQTSKQAQGMVGR